MSDWIFSFFDFNLFLLKFIYIDLLLPIQNSFLIHEVFLLVDLSEFHFEGGMSLGWSGQLKYRYGAFLKSHFLWFALGTLAHQVI